MTPTLTSKALPILLLLIIISVQAQITVQPPPTPTTSRLLNLTDSPNDQKLVISKRLQTLELANVTVNGTLKTNFKLISFNRRSAGNNDTYTFQLNGSWIHLKSSPQTLSCNLVMQNITKTLGLVRFDIENKQFKLLGALPMTTFTNMTVDSNLFAIIHRQVFIGEDCHVGSFTDRNTSQYTTYRATNNWTQIQIIGAISLASLQATSDDLNYGVYNNSLYRYNPVTFLYDNMFSFGPFQKVTIQNRGKRILLSGSNSVVIDNTTNPMKQKTTYTIYILHDVGSIDSVGKFQVVDAFEQGHSLMIMTSPKLTKLGFGYRKNSSDHLTIVAKHIDYTANQVVDILFQDPVQYAQTVIGINAGQDLDFSDSFLVVRNGSKRATNPTDPCFEAAYQFVGNQVIQLTNRTLAGSPDDREFYSFKKIRIDSSINDRLVVLNMYNTTHNTANNHYGVDQVVYGNIASNRQIVVPPTPPYANFAQPDHDHIFRTPGLLQWGYTKAVSGNTTVTVIHIDNSTANHISTSTFSKAGALEISFQSPKCQIISSNTSIFIYKFNETTKTFLQFGDASSIIASTNITNTTSVWWASQECDRLRVNSSIYYRVNQTAYLPVDNTPNFIPSDLDHNLTLAISQSGQIWRYNQTSNNYSIIYDISQGNILPETKMIYAEGNRLVVIAKNTSKLQAFAFAAQPNGRFATCFNYTHLGNIAEVQISPKLSKLLILAPINATDFKADLFFIDYLNLTNKSIDFPKPALLRVNETKVHLDDRFMYIRQLQNATATIEFKDSVFFFAQNIVAKAVFTNPYVKDTTNLVWVKSIIVNPTPTSTYLVTQLLNKTSTPYNRTIRVREINAQSAELNSNSNAITQMEIVDGKVKLCPRGCTSCECTSCVSGFVYDSSSKTCLVCAPGCVECDVTVQSKCTSCYPRYFLNSTGNCQPCQSPCITCLTTATSCSKCPPGQYFSAGLLQCDNCPKNCFNCTNNSTCTTCQPGFVLNPSNHCRKCSIKCSSCLASNITSCTSCGKGLQLVNGDCTSCPSNCLSCSNGQCAECANGYNVNSNGVCVLNCKIPCVTCVQNQPTQCLSCQSGSILSSTSCLIDSSCNGTDSCTDCGQGLNYYLMSTISGAGANCLACPSIPNCIQCSSSNTYKCSICANGFYIDENSDCSACSSSCTSCVSSLACTGCTSGYTLLDGYSQGQCLTCSSPCATCQGSTTYCTSCVSGFTKKNWMCQNNTFISIKFVINAGASTFLNDIDAIIAGLLLLLNQTNVNVITLNSIANGSIVPTLSVSPTTVSLSAAAGVLTAGLASGIPGTSYTVSGVVVTEQGVTAATTTETQQSGPNVGLIVGLTVGLTLLAVGIVVTIVLVKKFKAAASILVAEQSSLNVNVPVQSKQSISVPEYSNGGIELKESIDVDLHFAKQF